MTKNSTKPAAPAPLPRSGGSWTRLKDGSLVRNGAAAPEAAAEAKTSAETKED